MAPKQQQINPSRFPIVDVPSTCTIQDLAKQLSITIPQNRGFYSLRRTEPKIAASKEIIAIRQSDGVLFQGLDARKETGMGEKDLKSVKPADYPDWDIYVQSTSFNRKLQGGWKLMYENTDEPLYTTGSTNKRSKRQATTNTTATSTTAADPPPKKAKKSNASLKPKKSNLTTIFPWTTDSKTLYHVGYPTTHSKKPTPQTSSGVVASSREIYRAILEDDASLLTAILSDTKHIVNPLRSWSIGCPNVTPLSKAIEKDRRSLVKLLLEYTKSVNTRGEMGRVQPPTASSLHVHTGGLSYRTFGHATAAVGVSRGGKEGNNALLMDVLNSQDNAEWDPEVVSSAGMVDYLSVLNPDAIHHWGSNGFYNTVAAGNVECAARIAEMLFERDGYGLNTLHVQVLSLDSKKSLTKFTKPQVCKKAYENNAITPVHCAAIRGETTKFLEALLDANPAVANKVMDGLGRTPMHFAAAARTDKAVKCLIKRGFDVDVLDAKGVSPLALAARYGRHHNIKLLLPRSNKKNSTTNEFINTVPKGGKSPLMEASLRGHAPTVALLLQNGADPTMEDKGDKKRAIHYAAEHGHVDVVGALLKASPDDVDAPDKKKRTPLLYASSNGHLPLVTYLLTSHSADPNLADSSGNTILHHAAAYGWDGICQILVCAGANPAPVNDWKLKPHVVAHLKGHDDVAKMLMSKEGVEVDDVDNDGRTLLSLTCDDRNEGTLDQVKFLLERGADATIADLEGRTPLHYLCQGNAHSSDAEILKLLLDAGANGGAKTKDGMAPLAIALRNKRVEMVKALMECPCDVSGVDEDMGQTVFHKLMVLHFKDLDIFSALKTMMTFEGAKEAVSVVDKHGYTPALLFVKLLYKDETKTKEVVKYKQEICQVVKELLSLSNDINATVQAWDEKSQEKEAKRAFNSLRWHERHHRNIQKWQDMPPIKQPFLGWSLLHFATALLLPELIETCLSSGAAIDAMNNEGLTPLQRAFQNMEQITDLGRRFFLPQTNNDKNHHHHVNKKQKLSHEEINDAKKVATATARTQAFATITKLIQSGANVNAVDKSGTTCLCHALLSFIHDEQHDLSMLRLILNNTTASGNNNIKTEISTTSIDSKAITAPVDINHENGNGETVIHILMQNISKLPLEVGQSILNLMLDVTGVHVTKQDKKGNTPLHYAVKACRTESASAFEAVATLVSRSDDNDNNNMMNHQNKIGQTPLTYALANATGDDPIELVSEVLSSCQNIDLAIADVDGLTALHYCAIYGCTTCAVYLLRRGADGEAIDAWGNTPLALAVRMGHEGLVLMFFNQGAKCDGEIQWGVKKDDGAVVQYVHKREDGDNCGQTKAKDNEEEEDDEEEEEECMSVESEEACDADMSDSSNKSIKEEEDAPNTSNTLEEKAEIKMERNSIFYQVVNKNWKGLAYLMVYENIPMTTAVRETYITGKPEMVVRILQKVSTSRLQQLETNTGRNLFHIIASLPSNVMKHLNYVTARLLKCGLDASIRDTTTRGMTPLHLAAESGNTAMVSFLLTQQIVRDQINLTTSADDDQNTALYIAVKNNQLPIVHALLDAGADPNILPPSSDTLLLLSIRRSQRDLTSLLLHHDSSRTRIDVNARGADGLAALHVAVDMNDAESCALLLDHESTDVTVKDAAGKTCIHHVVDPLPGGWGSYENVSLLETLVEKGADPTVVDHDLRPPLFYAYRHYSSAMCEALLAIKGVKEDKALEKEAMASREEEQQLPPLVDLDVDHSMDAIKLRENTEKAAETSEGKITVPKVDTVADMGNSCDVVEDTVSGGYYDVIMNETKVSYGSYGKSMFYKMQLLNHKTKDMVILWTRYGRVGEEGQNQRTPFDDLAKGKKEFEKIYKSKTGNVWSKRHNFERKPNKYLPQNIVDADKARQIQIKSIDDLLKDKTTTCQKTKLPPPVLNLLRAVTDVHKMRAAMSSGNMQINNNAMPLGQLSRDSLEKGYSLLKDKIIPRVQKLQALYNKDQPNPNTIQKLQAELDNLSNEYYDIIPHDWKWGSVQTLNDASVVDHEVHLMENLLDLEVAVRILAGAQLRATDIHPADYVCAALNVGLQVMKKTNNPIFDAISKYAQLTSEDQFEVADILMVNHTEKDFNDELLPRMLLWHGSGLANFIGILAQGLRIAPLSAPASGYMFGKGIYCADMVQKSMAYTQSYHFPENNNTQTNGVHYLFLCDVALGDASEEIESVYMEKPREGYDSTKGVGWTGPNEDGDVVTLEGTTIPLGNAVKKKRDEMDKAKNPVLNYNEYIVYNTNQCRIRYIVQLARK